jgi:hypothetical protein
MYTSNILYPHSRSLSISGQALRPVALTVAPPCAARQSWIRQPRPPLIATSKPPPLSYPLNPSCTFNSHQLTIRRAVQLFQCSAARESYSIIVFVYPSFTIILLHLFKPSSTALDHLSTLPFFCINLESNRSSSHYRPHPSAIDRRAISCCLLLCLIFYTSSIQLSHAYSIIHPTRFIIFVHSS